MTKTLDEQFRDWEAHVFGFGYGTGEAHVIGALKDLFDLLEPGKWDPDGETSRVYDYAKLEAALTPRVAWLLINALCKADIIEYGASPRYGWMTTKGERLRDYIQGSSLECLLDVLDYDSDYAVCMPHCCNCGPTGWVEGARCYNAFWCQ